MSQRQQLCPVRTLTCELVNDAKKAMMPLVASAFEDLALEKAAQDPQHLPRLVTKWMTLCKIIPNFMRIYDGSTLHSKMRTLRNGRHVGSCRARTSPSA